MNSWLSSKPKLHSDFPNLWPTFENLKGTSNKTGLNLNSLYSCWHNPALKPTPSATLQLGSGSVLNHLFKKKRERYYWNNLTCKLSRTVTILPGISEGITHVHPPKTINWTIPTKFLLYASTTMCCWFLLIFHMKGMIPFKNKCYHAFYIVHLQK